MSQTPQRSLERAMETAQRDYPRPLPSTRPETGEPIWLVQSRSDPARVYTLTVEGDTIRCQCVHFQHRGVCAHAAAVRLILQAQQRPTPAASPTRSPAPPRSAASRRAEERRRQKEAEHRERALLWTDDKPFSIWKS